MTTGRINQVTILNPRAKRRDTAPKDGGCERYHAGRATKVRAQPRPSKAPKEPRRPTTDSVAPTEFPKGQAAAGGIGPESRQPSPHVSLKRRRPARGSSRLTGCYPPRPTPEHLLTDHSEANNPQTQKGACCHKTTGLLIPSANPGAADRRVDPLTNIGVNLPEQEAEMGPDPRWLADQS
jgi:hypothetical protein